MYRDRAHTRIHAAAAHGYLCIELNIRYIIHFKFFLLACPEIVCIIRTRTWKSADYLHRRGAACARERASERAEPDRASERERAVITFYFKDGRGSFAILCRTSICLIYRNYTYTDPVRFCHNLYPEYRRTRPAVSFCVRVYEVSWRSAPLNLRTESRVEENDGCCLWLSVVITNDSELMSQANQTLGVSSSAQSFIFSTMIFDHRWRFYLISTERKIFHICNYMLLHNYDYYCYSVINNYIYSSINKYLGNS